MTFNQPLCSYVNPHNASDIIILTHTPHIPQINITQTIIQSIIQLSTATAANTTYYGICQLIEYKQQDTIQPIINITIQHICTDKTIAQSQCTSNNAFLVTLYCTRTQHINTQFDNSINIISHELLQWSDSIYKHTIHQFIRLLHRHNSIQSPQQYCTLKLQCVYDIDSGIPCMTWNILCMLPAVQLQLKPINTVNVNVSQPYLSKQSCTDEYGYVTLNEWKQYVLITYNELHNNVPHTEQIPVIGLWSNSRLHSKQLYNQCIEYIYSSHIEYRISIEPLKFVLILFNQYNTMSMYEINVLNSNTIIQQYHGGCTSVVNTTDHTKLQLHKSDDELNQRLYSILNVAGINDMSLNSTNTAIHEHQINHTPTHHNNNTTNNSSIKRSILKKCNTKKQQQHSVTLVTPSKAPATAPYSTDNDMLQTPIRVDQLPVPTPHNSAIQNNNRHDISTDTIPHLNQLESINALQLFSPIPSINTTASTQPRPTTTSIPPVLQAPDMSHQINILTNQVTQLTSLMSNQLQLNTIHTQQHGSQVDVSTFITPIKLSRHSIQYDMSVQVTPSLYNHNTVESAVVSVPVLDTAEYITDNDYNQTNHHPNESEVKHDIIRSDSILHTDGNAGTGTNKPDDTIISADNIHEEVEEEQPIHAEDSVSQIDTVERDHHNGHEFSGHNDDSDNDDEYRLMSDPSLIDNNHHSAAEKQLSPAASTDISIQSNTSLMYNTLYNNNNSLPNHHIDRIDPILRCNVYNSSDSDNDSDMENECNNIVKKYISKSARNSGKFNELLYQPQKYIHTE